MPVTTQVRVRYAETDQMGIVYYANYLVWFELGRVELLRSLGLAYSHLEKDHSCILPVVDAHCRYRAPARYDDEILIETRPAMLRGSVIKFAYRIYCATAKTKATRTRSWPKAKPCTWSATTSCSASRCPSITPQPSGR